MDARFIKLSINCGAMAAMVASSRALGNKNDIIERDFKIILDDLGIEPKININQIGMGINTIEIIERRVHSEISIKISPLAGKYFRLSWLMAMLGITGRESPPGLTVENYIDEIVKLAGEMKLDQKRIKDLSIKVSFDKDAIGPALNYLYDSSKDLLKPSLTEALIFEPNFLGFGVDLKKIGRLIKSRMKRP